MTQSGNFWIHHRMLQDKKRETAKI